MDSRIAGHDFVGGAIDDRQRRDSVRYDRGGGVDNTQRRKRDRNGVSDACTG